MNLEQSDARDGKNIARQWGLTIFYILAFIILFLLIMLLIIGMSQWTFGFNGFTRGIQLAAGPIALLILIIIISRTYDLYGVNPAGNKAVATINMFFAEKLPDGGTMFTIYTAGFSLKWPWERKLKEEIDLERDQTNKTVDFNVTVAGSKLEFSMKLSYKPHPIYLSSYLGNVGDHDALIEQVVASGQQLTEEIASRYGDAELVRKNPSALAIAVRRKLQDREANKFGFLLTSLSYPKCDYDSKVQDAMNKKRVRDIANEMMTDYIKKKKMSPAEAARTAMLIMEIPNVSNEHYSLQIDAPAELMELINSLGAEGLRTILLALGNKSNSAPADQGSPGSKNKGKGKGKNRRNT